MFSEMILPLTSDIVYYIWRQWILLVKRFVKRFPLLFESTKKFRNPNIVKRKNVLNPQSIIRKMFHTPVEIHPAGNAG